MTEPTPSIPFQPGETPPDALTAVLQQSARRILAAALEAEVEEHLARFEAVRDLHGRQAVVRNGYLPERQVLTGLGPVAVQQPRVRNRETPDGTELPTFTSQILPRYLRKARAIEELIPWLYLKGISTGGYQEALGALFGPNAPGLSPSTIVRLKKAWEDEHEAWQKRSLEGSRYVYVWADGIYFNVRLEDGRACILVLIGATADGRKELLAVHDGERESEQSWTELLLDLKRRGLTDAPQLAIGDGALGFWKAVAKVWPDARSQRCWTHKTANVLNRLPKKQQPEGKRRLHEIWMADTRKEASAAFDHFTEVYGAKHPKAVACLTKDRDQLLAFYDFPAEHWRHLRTTNPIESTFATVRLRTRRTKGSGSRAATLAMVFKLTQSAEKCWRRLNGHQLLGDLIDGIPFKDGIKESAAA